MARPGRQASGPSVEKRSPASDPEHVEASQRVERHQATLPRWGRSRYPSHCQSIHVQNVPKPLLSVNGNEKETDALPCPLLSLRIEFMTVS